MKRYRLFFAAVFAICSSALFGAFSTDRVPEKTYANTLTLDVLSGDERLQSSRAYVLLRAEGGITGLPVCAAANVTLGLSPDGKSLVLRRRATGVILFVR